MSDFLDIPEPDRIYEALIDAQADFSPDEARQFMARLALLLAAHVGDVEAILAAIGDARSSVQDER